jgi:hypothetical protein
MILIPKIGEIWEEYSSNGWLVIDDDHIDQFGVKVVKSLLLYTKNHNLAEICYCESLPVIFFSRNEWTKIC